MSSLPEHLVVDILLRLPASSVIRFGCVCKSWYSLFRDPNFILSQFAMCENNQPRQLLVQKFSNSVFCDTISLLSDNGDCFESQSLSKSLGLPMFQHFNLRVAGSCNGILCFFQSAFNREFVLFNPLIKHCLWLPISKTHLRNHFVGFGFDIASKDFKILKFECSSASGELYSLNSNSWRGISVPKFSFIFNQFGAFVNGALHWVVRVNHKNSIFVFDVKDETFRQIALPSCYVDSRPYSDFNVTEFGGSSIAVTLKLYSTIYASHETDVWVMKEYGVTESWTHLATTGEQSMVLMIGDQDQVFIMFGLNRLASQKINQTTVKNLMAVGQRESFSVHRYVPSLFLLDKEISIQARTSTCFSPLGECTTIRI